MEKQKANIARVVRALTLMGFKPEGHPGVYRKVLGFISVQVQTPEALATTWGKGSWYWKASDYKNNESDWNMNGCTSCAAWKDSEEVLTSILHAAMFASQCSKARAMRGRVNTAVGELVKAIEIL